LAFGLYLGIFLKPIANPFERAPAAIPTKATTEAEVVNYLKQAGINKVASLYRMADSEFRSQTLYPYFQDLAKFQNFADHQRWLKTVGQQLFEKTTQWRGFGTVVLGGQSSEVELMLTTAGACFEVEAYIMMNGMISPLNGSSHCATDLLYRDGDYYMSWMIYDQFLDSSDLSILSVNLPQSKAPSIRYWIDGETQWQISAITWTPVSESDRSLRVSEISKEMLKGGR
jgi:hypothetical protein